MAANFACETRNPKDPDGPLTEATIPGILIEYCYKNSPVKYENFRAAKHVLENVERIFWGVREYNEGGWCYTGRPETWCIRPDIEAPFPGHLVFAVYLNPNMWVYEFRAEYAADDDSLNPIDWENRYRSMTWKSTS